MASLLVRMPPAAFTPMSDLAGRGLDEVGAGQHREPTRSAHVVEGSKFPGLEDDLEVRAAADLLDRHDLVEHPLVFAGEKGAAVDDHVNLIGACGNCVTRIEELDGEARASARKGSRNGSDMDAVANH